MLFSFRISYTRVNLRVQRPQLLSRIHRGLPTVCHGSPRKTLSIDRNSGCPLHILGESSELQIAAIKSALLTSSVLFDNSKSKANNIPTKKPRSCPNLRSSSADLNYPSFSVVFKPHNLIHITRRTVTNVGAAPRVCEMAVNSSGHSP